MARVVELRFFGGLSLAETGALLGASRDTVKADWRVVRTWMNRKLFEQVGGDEGS